MGIDLDTVKKLGKEYTFEQVKETFKQNNKIEKSILKLLNNKMLKAYFYQGEIYFSSI
jgi:hypothetical protein